MSTYRWGGHEFEVYQPDTEWNDVGGVYIFTVQRPAGLLGDSWQALYVGKAESFKNRLDLSNHEKWPAAVKLGVTHIHTLVEQGSIKRTLVEALLIPELKPPLNTQLK